jgi:hypothetical protein
MAKAANIKLTRIETIAVTFPNSNKPHDAAFSGSKNVHKRGHIWLTNYTTGHLQLSFKLATPGYTFVSDPAGDGAAALYLSADPTKVTRFAPPPGAFSTPSLSADNLLLQVIVNSIDAMKYFYILNIQYRGGRPFSISDPIIVNR